MSKSTLFDCKSTQFEKLLKRRNQLWDFYNTRRLSNELPKVNAIIAQYAYDSTLASLKDTYNDVPPEWEEDLKHFNTDKWYYIKKKLRDQNGSLKYTYLKPVRAGELSDDVPPNQQLSCCTKNVEKTHPLRHDCVLLMMTKNTFLATMSLAMQWPTK